MMTLDKMAVGQTGVIRAVGGEGVLRLRLLDMGLIPRTEVTVSKIAPMYFGPSRFGMSRLFLMSTV